MGDVNHDSTFAFRVAKAKKIVRYNGRICPRCNGIYLSKEPNCPFCNGRLPIQKRKKPNAAKANAPSRVSMAKSEMALCGHCGFHMPLPALEGHLLRKHGTTLNIEAQRKESQREKTVRPLAKVVGGGPTTRELAKLEHTSLKDMIPKIENPRPPSAALQSTAPPKPNTELPRTRFPHEARILAEVDRCTRDSMRGDQN